MNRANPSLRHFAERLIVHEAREDSSPAQGPATFQVPEKLRPPLVKLMGGGGFRALLARALALATAEIPTLRAVRVRADGTLEGLEELQLDAGEFLEARVVLLARLLGLLVAFIGEGLTLQLMRELWPKLPLDDLDFGESAGNEKTKKGRSI